MNTPWELWRGQNRAIEPDPVKSPECLEKKIRTVMTRFSQRDNSQFSTFSNEKLLTPKFRPFIRIRVNRTLTTTIVNDISRERGR